MGPSFIVTNKTFFSPPQGVGVGLRPTHYPDIFDQWPAMDWFEAISENFMDTGGRPIYVLEKIRDHYPIALHGTSLSIGSVDPLRPQYLKQLKALIERISPFIVSDHLCWTSYGKEELHDLLPLPLTEETIRHVVGRVNRLQDFLGRKILLENVSTYVTYKHSAMPEWEFLAEISRRSGCGILLDINNIYVNSFNHRFDALNYIENIPAEVVGQFHLAGHTNKGEYLFDTHSAAVIEPVWDLYRAALKRFGRTPTLIEWDDEIPSWRRLSEEAEKARGIYARVHTKDSSSPHGVRRGSVKDDFRLKACLPAGQAGGNDEKMNAVRSQPEVSLAKVQQIFKQKIQPLRKATQKLNFNKILNPQGSVSGAERMSVYSEGYLARIRESLLEVYETIRVVLGEQKFSALSWDYAHAVASINYDLGKAGYHLPGFLKTHPSLKEYPFLAILAQFEWQAAKAFHSYDLPPLDPASQQHASLEDWEKSKIIFQPSVSLINSNWHLLDLWRKRRSKHEFSGNPPQEKELILIGRREFQVRCEVLDEAQYRLVNALLGGKTLGLVCQELAERGGSEDLPVMRWFGQWMQDGLIVNVERQKLVKRQKIKEGV